METLRSTLLVVLPPLREGVAVLLIFLPSGVSLGVDGQSHQLEAHRGREVVGLVQLVKNRIDPVWDIVTPAPYKIM